MAPERQGGGGLRNTIIGIGRYRSGCQWARSRVTRSRAGGLGWETRAWALGFGPGSDPGCWKPAVVHAPTGVWRGWPPYWLVSCLQDSDGDKSDDLVVDVSNEVSTGPGGSVLGLGWFEVALFLPRSCCVSAAAQTLLTCPEQGTEASGAGAPGWSGGGGQGFAAGWLGFLRMGTSVGRCRCAPRIPREGQVLEVRSVIPTTPGISRVGGREPLGISLGRGRGLERRTRGQETPPPKYES